jgi:hypothetical protein
MKTPSTMNWREARDTMAQSRVIVLQPEQAEAVPPLSDSWIEEIDLLAGVRLPFPATFLEIGAGFKRSGHTREAPWSETPLYGALLTEAPGRVGCACMPVWCVDGQPLLQGYTAPIGTNLDDLLSRNAARSSGRSLRGESSLLTTVNTDARPNERAPEQPHSERIGVWHALPPALLGQTDPNTGQTVERESSEALRAGTVRALRAMYLLESSNVELVERTEALPRAHRAHGIPHYDVSIRQNNRRTKGDPSGQHIDYSHRFEVRGHFKHFGPDTRLFQASGPAKVLDLPDRGACVRLWCPPFVKGPADKPLIPKRRKLAARAN